MILFISEWPDPRRRPNPSQMSDVSTRATLPKWAIHSRDNAKMYRTGKQRHVHRRFIGLVLGRYDTQASRACHDSSRTLLTSGPWLSITLRGLMHHPTLVYLHLNTSCEMAFWPRIALSTSQIPRKQETWQTKAEEADLTETIKSLRAQDRRSSTFICTLARVSLTSNAH